MRQIGAETEDPLKRIQEEINEVARREQELRQGHRRTDSADYCLSSANSDDSGLSLSPSPVHSPSVSNLKDKIEAVNSQQSASSIHDTLANGNRHLMLPQAKALTRARSTPQLFQISPNRRFNPNPNQRGIMQKFIASRGRLNKLQSTPGNNVNSISSLNSNHLMKIEQHVSPIELNRSNMLLPPTAISAPPVIERDSNGKPIRRGYIPVEEKIQKELRDLKNRESELKRLRKQNRVASQSNLVELCYERYFSSDSGEELSDEDNTETIVFPLSRKLRSTKSIGELCEAMTNSSLSPRETPSPQFENRQRSASGMRPAMSLAQLCDLTPEEAPSSHKLIAQWENLIQQKQQRQAASGNVCTF
ncbi:uncharacterized protein LOC131436183 isoform X4 [Malaya genurostris]|uniref:uncharacterized protein LOC131436183 isoform X4 n=1 Tax=Malaya genurostris TaxID=325434 RepID=UPI0026F3856A|nr:uncharacterized protein LOC131436183 isoform X4 [Malaya genurostris]